MNIDSHTQLHIYNVSQFSPRISIPTKPMCKRKNLNRILRSMWILSRFCWKKTILRRIRKLSNINENQTIINFQNLYCDQFFLPTLIMSDISKREQWKPSHRLLLSNASLWISSERQNSYIHPLKRETYIILYIFY